MTKAIAMLSETRVIVKKRQVLKSIYSSISVREEICFREPPAKLP
jgi:hypothetical protein